MLGQPLAGGAEGTAHPAREGEAGTPKILRLFRLCWEELQRGSQVRFSRSQRVFGLVCNEPGEATRNSSYCSQSEPLMKTSGASKLRCKRVLPDQRCSSGSGKPGINYILLPAALPVPVRSRGTTALLPLP